jgi:hypothetical protein
MADMPEHDETFEKPHRPPVWWRNTRWLAGRDDR